MGQRTVTPLYDATSASGGSLDSGIFNVELYNKVLVHLIATGAAAPASGQAKGLLEDGTVMDWFGLTLPVAGGSGITSLINVPRRAKFQTTAGAASTVRMAVYGIREQ